MTSRPADVDYPALRPQLLAHARTRNNNHADDEDLVQDAILAILQQPAVRQPLVYGRRAITSRIISAARHQAVVLRTLPRLAETGTSDPDVAIILTVRQAVEQLPPGQRRAIILTYWAGLTESQTATTMRISNGTVKTHLSKGKRHLAALLEAA